MASMGIVPVRLLPCKDIARGSAAKERGPRARRKPDPIKKGTAFLWAVSAARMRKAASPQ